MSKTAYFSAARNWDAGALRSELAKQPDLHLVRDVRGRTALHICARMRAPADPARVSESIATARQLIDAGVEIDAVHAIPDDGEIFPATALWYALAWGRNPGLARFLLAAGASPENCLWTVIWSIDPEMVRELLRAGARTDAVFNGETPLIYAARLGREEIIVDLLDAGASIADRDRKGVTAAEHARRRKLTRGVLALLDS